MSVIYSNKNSQTTAGDAYQHDKGHSLQQSQKSQGVESNILDVQRKLSIGEVDDPLEREADYIADQVMRMPENALLQRKCSACEEEDRVYRNPLSSFIQRKGADGEFVTSDSVSNRIFSSKGKGIGLSGSTKSFMESRFGTEFSNINIHKDRKAAHLSRALEAKAFTVGNDIFFNEGEYNPDSNEGKHLLAHELAHTIQQNRNQKTLRNTVQRENGEDRSRRNPAAVANARRRLEQIEPRLSSLQARRLQIEAERLRILHARQRLDYTMFTTDPLSGAPGSRQATEDSNIGNLNQNPLRIEVNQNHVRFYIRFHVRFDNPSMRSRFAELRENIQAGIRMIWTQTLIGVFAGRQFTIVPQLTLIDATTPRDQNFWLISVRDRNLGQPSYSGCTLGQVDSRVPTSMAVSDCDGGVMLIPPSHITKPGVLGHELLHLFGLVDRYSSIISQRPGQRPVVVNAPFRITRGRRDPLGAENGTLLREDLGYLFDRFGVYSTELSRNASDSSGLEREVLRLREIIRLGYDPNSLIRIRRDFRDRIIESVENI